MKPLDHFGEFITQNLHDRAIERHLRMQKGAYKTPALQELQRDIMSLAVETKKLLLECIADSIHATTHDFLFALQEAHDRKLGIEVTVDGVNIAAESDGLQGELFGDNGWVAKYSKYPNVFDGR